MNKAIDRINLTDQTDQGSEFYNNLLKKFLKENNIEMYSTCNEGRSVVAGKFIKTLKSKIFKHKTAVSKNACFDVLDNIVDNYNNTFHRIIGMKPIDIKSDSYVEYNVDSNEKDPKIKVRDHVRISKYNNIFAKGYTPNWPKEIFVISKIKSTVPWTYVVIDLNVEEITGTFRRKNCRRQIKKCSE